ncbi:indoleamine 2,3-dioxygenase 2-like [Argopecten irradians]|uniref:indoleamine 2,3-dioxygenase 2-like n=1 Tax=Argopecten irradians TaxID=31199 RepID=UPI003712EE65
MESESQKDKLILEEFHVSEKTGFTVLDNLEKLPDYFQPWNDLADRIVELMESKTVRKHIDKLELLDHMKLSGEAELRLAHIQLCLFVSGYVWQDGPQDPAKKIPRCIAVPFHGVSQRLSLPPVMCYCNITLWNWRPIDPEAPLTLDNIRMFYLLPGGKESDNFLRSFIVLEVAFAPAIQRIMDAIYAVEASDSASLTNCLENVAAVIRNMTEMLNKYRDYIKPETFFNILQVYFGGYGPNTPLPPGLVFEGVSDEPVYANSCNAAETSTIHLLDAALGIKHSEGTREKFQSFRQYMPAGHRRLIELVQQRSGIHQFVNNSGDKALSSAFESCQKALADFRSFHIQLVTKYLVIPSKGSIPGVDEIMGFLKGLRNESTAK